MGFLLKYEKYRVNYVSHPSAINNFFGNGPSWKPQTILVPMIFKTHGFSPYFVNDINSVTSWQTTFHLGL